MTRTWKETWGVRRAILAGNALLCLLASGAGATAGESPPAAPPDAPTPPADFREVIAAAKARVFPALIYVAPVVEEYRGGRREMREVGGSGVIVSPDGYAVTNWHVIEKSVHIRVHLSDGRFTTARKIGEDRDTDIGLIQLEIPPGATTLPHADLADSDRLEQGEFVLALGAPWGLSRSVSLGILSATNRYLDGKSEYSLWLQTDASINPGNSGGPLVDTHGEVIGINTLGMSGGGDLGFAVPSNTARKIVTSLRAHGSVRRAWTGLRLQPLRDFSKNIVFEGENGVLVASVDRGSPAQQAGIEAGDLIFEIGEVPVKGTFQEELPAINTLLGDLEVDKELRVSLQRGAEPKSVSLVPREKGQVEGEDLELEQWSMTVKAINEFEHPSLAFYARKGVFVQGLRYPGNASGAGLRRNDILVKVDGVSVESIEDLRRVYVACVGAERHEKRVLLEVLRGGATKQLVLDYSTKYDE